MCEEARADAREAVVIRLFGGLSIRVDDTPWEARLSRSQRALLVMMLLHRDVGRSRASYAAELWPDAFPEQARSSLRTTFHRLKRALPPCEALLEADGEALRWVSDASTRLDIARFEALAGAADVDSVREIMGLYTGDLCPDIAASWIEPHRERFRRRYREVLRVGVGLWRQRHDFAAALEAAERLVVLDPLDEAGYRSLMELHLATGDRAGAREAYDRCRVVLQEELGEEPCAELRSLLTVSRASPAMPQGSDRGPEPIGRTVELRMLREAWQRAERGHLTVAAIIGEPGAGKTFLADAFARWATGCAISVASGRCYPTAQRTALAPLAELLKASGVGAPSAWPGGVERPLEPSISGAFGRSGSAGAPVDRVRLFQGLSRAICSPQPRMLLLDDIHWADQETLAWLEHLAQHCLEHRLLLVLTIGSDEPGQLRALEGLFKGLDGASGLVPIHLAPLEDPDARKLVSRQGALPAGESLERLLRLSRGNALCLVELARNPRVLHDGSGQKALPPALGALVERRLAPLSPAAFALLRRLAVLDRGCPVQRLVATSPFGELDSARALEELLERQLIVASGGRAEVAHPLIGEHLRRTLSPSQFRRIRRDTEDETC